MARTSVLDSATTQFFVNTVDNVALDTASLRAAYTVADLSRDADLAVAVAQLRTP